MHESAYLFKFTLFRGSEDGSDDTEENTTNLDYSNASEQLLILCPSMILTIHLNRFLQTFRGIKKQTSMWNFLYSWTLLPSALVLLFPFLSCYQPNQSRSLIFLHLNIFSTNLFYKNNLDFEHFPIAL